jgi:hypothetical protein
VARHQDIISLTCSDIVGFIERHVRDHSPRSAKHMCSAVRVFMRFLQYRRYIAAELASCVSSVSAWRLGILDVAMSDETALNWSLVAVATPSLVILTSPSPDFAHVYELECGEVQLRVSGHPTSRRTATSPSENSDAPKPRTDHG